MTIATYPDDAQAPITAFSVVATETFNNTGTTRVAFNLPSAVTSKGEVTAFDDGILQSTLNYSLSNAGQTITFADAPNATQLVIKTITLPARYRLTRTFPEVVAADFSNTSPTVINGNNYIINGVTESFSFPAVVNVSSTSDFIVYVGGVFQQTDAYTYPSVILGNQGIDIGDNAAVGLLTNFAGNLTDSSPKAHTVAINSGSASFNQSNLVLDASKFINVPSSNSFNVGQEASFTFDTIITPDSGASMSANQTLLARFQDQANYYYLRTVGSNATVGFVIKDANSLTEIYGGNCNGGTTYNVAVSYDKTTANLRLYVADVLVKHVNYNPSVPRFIAPLIIGANSNVAGGSAASQERYKGKIEYIRMAEGARYRTTTINALTTTATVIGGAPLGSLDIHDSLSVRVFDSSVTVGDRFNSMADRKPDSGFGTNKKFAVNTFTSQAGYEKRRLKSRRGLRAYDLTYTNITGVERTAIENFYNARSGEFESFSFDLSHLNEAGTISTRFDGDLQISQVLSAGTSLTENFYTVSFKLQETYD
tara:strand:- start:371 stop:1984 length:1614 start_codon:yes stop_codon:yes gene_type:complete